MNLAHFETTGVAFDYPAQWQVFKEATPPPMIHIPIQVICKLQSGNSGEVGLFWMDVPPDTKGKDVFASAYDDLQTSPWLASIVKEGEENLGGKNFLIKEFQVPSWTKPVQFKHYWWEFGGKLFLFALVADLDEFQAFQTAALPVLETFSAQPDKIVPSTQPSQLIELEDLTLEFPQFWEVWKESQEKINPELNARILCTAYVKEPFRAMEILERDFSGLLRQLKMKDIFRLTYSGFNDPEALVKDVSEGKLSVAGVEALVKLYTHPHGEPWMRVEDVWLEVNGKILIISYTTYPEQFSSFEGEFKQILSSIRLKLKPTEIPTEIPTGIPPSPETITPSSTATETPSLLKEELLTARQAFSLVEPKVKAYNPQASLCGIFSGTFQAGEPVFEDGTSLAWEFWFIAPGEKIIISVKNGEVGEISQENYKGSALVPLPKNWMDSPMAIEKALNEFVRIHPEISDFKIADHGLLYEPFPVSGKGKVPAVCLYIQTSERYPYLVILDAETGEFIKESKM
ncbi:MAG: hypothetical protein QMD88_07745 [Coprothermobacterota bacterium]|nr:hypothetical protein [Coprothermobacterota bacterium]